MQDHLNSDGFLTKLTFEKEGDNVTLTSYSYSNQKECSHNIHVALLFFIKRDMGWTKQICSRFGELDVCLFFENLGEAILQGW